MPQHQFRWHRIFGVYFALAAASLVAGACARPPLHDALLGAGVCLLGAFVPLVMAIYFLRGLLPNR